MTTDQIYQLLDSNDIDRLIGILDVNNDIETIKKALKQYDVSDHDVFDETIRKDKIIYKDSDTLVDENGQPLKVVSDIKKVNRVAAPIQKQVVLLRSAFVGNPTMKSSAEDDLQKSFVTALSKVWDDNKMPYKFSETMTRTMSELKCAWLWYNVEDKEYWSGYNVSSSIRPKVKVLSYQLGDILYPVFDNNGDMIAFGRAYASVDYAANFNKIDQKHLDVYTAERIYFKKQINGKWQDNLPAADDPSLQKVEANGSLYKKNLVGKIPITYFSQSKPEWDDVQTAANRIDELMSNHGETNNYYAWPILFGKGDVSALPDRDSGGKFIQGTGGDADLKFVAWDNAPESLKTELENLFEIVYNLTNTPRPKDFENLGQTSGFAIQLRFLMPILKAKEKEMSVFGEGVQRAYNYLKKLITVLDSRYVPALSLNIVPEFASALPNDINEEIDRLIKMKNNKLVSGEYAIEHNPAIADNAIETEKDRINSEEEAAQAIEAKKNTALQLVGKN